MPTSKKKSASKLQQDNEQASAKLPAASTTVQAVAKRYEETEFVDTTKSVWNYSLLTPEDVTNYQNGTNYQLYKKFGSHSIQVNGTWGMYFCVWAPNASAGKTMSMNYTPVGIKAVSGKDLSPVSN